MFENETVDNQADTTTNDPAVVEQAATEKPSLQTISDEIDSALSGKETAKPTQTTENQTVQDIIDLANAKKVKLDGKEFSIEELKRDRMLHADYTRKTQALSQERKFYENLPYDLEKVKQDPQKFLSEFKKVYPKTFHKFVSDFETVSGSEPSTRNQMPQGTAPRGSLRIEDLPPEVQSTIEYIKTQQNEAAQAAVDAVIEKHSTKYPLARQKEVLSEWNALIEAHKDDPSTYAKPTEQDVENLFKQSHEEIQSLIAKQKTQQTTAQLNANEKMRGPGSGGATPGTPPARARNMREAAAMARAAVLGSDADA